MATAVEARGEIHDDPLSRYRCAVLHGDGLAGIATLPGLLDPLRVVRPRSAGLAGADLVLAWGRKPSARRAEAWAAARGLPVCWLEDGFLRSVGLGDTEPPWAVVVDDQGIYYDARCPSRLESLISRPLEPAETERAEALIARWQTARVSKYNADRERPGVALPGDVLVVDQTAGDASIACGLADPSSFARMLEAALDEHPQARILLKVHPEVVAGRKQGHFPSLGAAARQRVHCLADRLHPPGLLETVAAVYVVTSQMGFEALLWGKPVRTFGMPFYAGWGLTADDSSATGRRGAASLAGLVHAALIDYPRCLDPETGQRCSPERLLDWMAWQREQRERFPQQVCALGFGGWKRSLLRRFMAGSEIEFRPIGADATGASTVVVWGQQAVDLPAGAAAAQMPEVIRVEDGFLRSVGLGADLVRPWSWVLDRSGLYYDCGRPSDLETLLRESDFGPELRLRARRLRERLLALGLTKYNLAGAGWQRPDGQRPVVLVVGQVESDAAIVYGAPAIRSNIGLLRAARAARPDAWLIYKPHPDVVAGLRGAGEGEGQAAACCDEVITGVSIETLLDRVDEVHVLSSLAGFEALLRGRRVVTWGCPFYAGWGLTDDRGPSLTARRGRLLDLDALTAAVLILYPCYVSPRSGHYASPEQVVEALAAERLAKLQRPARGAGAAWRWVLRRALRWGVAWRRSRIRLRDPS